MGKLTWREITKSLGRYLAIFAIVALGVGFFCGLRLTKTAMIRTLDRYTDKLSFYDFRLASTLGLTDSDVQAAAEQPGIGAAEGSVAVDALASVGSRENFVFHCISMPESINTLYVDAGRLPEQADECAADAWSFSESDIGRTITLSAENSEDTLDQFSQKTFTIVGIVHSPLYINYERGGASIGNGSVSAFLFLPRAAMDTSVYTDLYLTFQDKPGEVYSDAYDDAVQTEKRTLETFLDARVSARQGTLRRDAQRELDDAEKTLADSRKTLADSAESITDGKISLAGGWRSYYTGMRELAEQKTELENSLADAKQKLQNGEASLIEQKQAVADGETALAAASKTLETSAEQLKAGWDAYNRNLAALEAQKEQLAASGAQPDEQTQAALAAAQAELDAARAKLDESQKQYDAGSSQLAQQKEQLTSGEQQLAAAEQELESGWAAYRASEEDGRRQLQQAGGQLAEARYTLMASMSTLQVADAQLADGLKQLTKGEQDYEDGLSALQDLDKAKGYVLTRSENVGYACFESDSDIVRGVSRVFPLFFFMVAALVCITTMTRMVEEQRTQIGVLKALGYGKPAVFSIYLFYAGSASTLGCAAGALAGSYFLPKMIWQAYNIMYGFANILWAFDWPLVLISSFGYLVCALCATWYACNQELSRPAAELMRPKAPKAGRRVLFERIGFLWKRIPFLHKVSIRNILRYKQRMVMMAIGIGGCTALLLTGYGIQDSIQDVVNYQYEEITKYDLALSFRDSMDTEAQSAFAAAHGGALGSILYLSQNSMDCTRGSVTKSVSVTAAEGNSTEGFFDLHAKDEKLAYPKDGECLINTGLARALGAQKGDSLTLRSSDGQSFSVKIAGVFDNYVYNYVFLTPSTLRQGLGAEPEVKSAWVLKPDGSDVHTDAAELSGDAEVSNVQVNVDLRARIGNMMDSLKYIVYVVIVCAGALAFIVLYNLTNINITERLREIATVKVLGFYEGETRAYVFRENVVLTVLGILVGYPMGIWLHSYVMSQTRIDMVTFEVRILPVSYLYAAAFTVAFSLIVNFVMGFRIRNIHMAEALKSIE